MAKADRRKICACLHPDHVSDPVVKRRYDEASKLFNVFLPIRDVELE
jgi:hypothetical protein